MSLLFDRQIKGGKLFLHKLMHNFVFPGSAQVSFLQESPFSLQDMSQMLFRPPYYIPHHVGL